MITRRIVALLGCLALLRASAPEPNDVALVKRHVAFLTSINPPRNYAHIPSLEKAASYIKAELGRFTKSIRIQEYKVLDRTYKNIIANFGPADQPTIVIGAHYDVCGDQPGADDNASGVAGLLLLAKYLSERAAELRYNYELVFYSLEEPPYFRTEFMGSAIHAKSLADKKAQVKYMISLETIGYFSDAKGSQDYPVGLSLFYPSRGNFIAAIGRRADKKVLSEFEKNFSTATTLPIITLAAPSFVTGIDFSDHLNYWPYGWPAIMVTDTAFMRNKNYHEDTDTPDTLDYSKIVDVIRGVYGAIAQEP